MGAVEESGFAAGRAARPPAPARRGAGRQRAVQRADIVLRSIGQPNSIVRQVDFWDRSYEGRRLFAEALGTFFLVFVAAGGGIVSARLGGQAVPYAARATAPGLMVMAVILFMGALSGAHPAPP